MAKDSQTTRVRAWVDRIQMAQKFQEEWEKKYKCDRLEDFYLGHQWEDKDITETGQERYVINLCFPNVEVKIPSLFFYNPKFNVEVQEPYADSMGDIEERAKLLEDTLNTFAADSKVGFQDQSTLALKEGFYRFSVVEVGYTGNYIDNPNAGKPMLNDKGEEMRGDDGEPVLQPEKVLGKGGESLYVRRIPAHQFIVSIGGNNRLEWCDWYGYWEWKYVEDVKKNPAYKNTDTVKANGSWKSQYKQGQKERRSDNPDDEAAARRNMVKVWKIWDARTYQKIVLAEGNQKPLLEEPYEFCPFAVLKFHEIMDSFYPLPPMYNWLLPQVELNETREMMRVHRKRYYRRYTYRDGSIDENELMKLETGGDGVYAKANVDEPLKPVPDAPLDSAVQFNIPLTKDDLLQITGVSGEAKGAAEATTATQASIIDTRSRIRENYSRYQVSKWLASIGKLMLMTIRTKFTAPLMVRRMVDHQSPDAVLKAANVIYLWQEIQAEDLGEINYETSVDVESLSPLNEDVQRQQWLAWVQTLTPQKLMLMLASETILKKDLGYFGIKSNKQIQEIKKGLEAMLLTQSGLPPALAIAGVQGGVPGAPGQIATPQQAGVGPAGGAGPGATPFENRVNSQIAASVEAAAPGGGAYSAR